ncbi:hypothetical protein [Mycolicibacterium sp.]|uniref:hypothetical protein n=1 Tax=Mycolicibacterium sp. TaxID=2320850 RepID=UPI0035608432
MSWRLQPSVGDRTTYSRDLHERFVAYVDVDTDWERDEPLSYTWSVQDGSCGRVLDRGWVDGDQGLATAQLAAEEAAARLFPGQSL